MSLLGRAGTGRAFSDRYCIDSRQHPPLLRKRYFFIRNEVYSQPAQFRRMPDLNFQPVHGRNAPHDGPAQTTAALEAAGHPEESLAQARAVCIVKARPAVFHAQRHLPVL